MTVEIRVNPSYIGLQGESDCIYKWCWYVWDPIDHTDYIAGDLVRETIGTAPDTTPLAIAGAAVACPSNHTLLLHFNSDSESVPIDASLNELTGVYNNNAGLSSQSPSHFPEQKSVYFDGSLTTPDAVDITYPSSLILDGEFTIDFWFRMDDVTGAHSTHAGMQYIFASGIVGYSGASYTLAWNYDSGNPSNSWFAVNWGNSVYSGGSFNYVPANEGMGNLSNDTWYHVAITRDSNNYMYMFLNGHVNTGTYGSDEDCHFGSACTELEVDWGILRLGMYHYSGNAFYPFKGYIDEFRIVKGERMWTEDFSTEFASNPPSPYCVATGATTTYNVQLVAKTNTDAEPVVCSSTVQQVPVIDSICDGACS